ncbi:MAG: hypothetical protein H0X62_03585, partial [Bacteroidetes bacterium]|nr:hypothetical protein [Bacteroidota bacterium]
KLALVVILALSAVAAYLYFSNHTGTIKKELKDFSVKDTAQVTGIFLADNFGNKVKLDRKSESVWMVNDKYETRKDAIKLILGTIHTMEVKSPVSKASFENVITQISAKHTKVEIYMGKNKPVKTFYVGGSTKDQFGTYMMLENSSVPFVMHIPGFFGYLSTRFFTEEENWRSTALFRYNLENIEKIAVNYMEFPQESFEIEKISSKKPVVKSILTGKTIENLDTLAVLYYASKFQNINVEFYGNDLEAVRRDSIITHCKRFSVEITDIHGNKDLFTAFRKPMPEGSEDEEGNPQPFDKDRMYGLTKNGDFVLIQFFVFDEITPRFAFFEQE